jgi:hypothetical protein
MVRSAWPDTSKLSWALAPGSNLRYTPHSGALRSGGKHTADMGLTRIILRTQLTLWVDGVAFWTCKSGLGSSKHPTDEDQLNLANVSGFENSVEMLLTGQG